MSDAEQERPTLPPGPHEERHSDTGEYALGLPPTDAEIMAAARAHAPLVYAMSLRFDSLADTVGTRVARNVIEALEHSFKKREDERDKRQHALLNKLNVQLGMFASKLDTLSMNMEIISRDQSSLRTQFAGVIVDVERQGEIVRQVRDAQDGTNTALEGLIGSGLARDEMIGKLSRLVKHLDECLDRLRAALKARLPEIDMPARKPPEGM